MRKISKTSTISELLFESEDGSKYPYEGLALEHDFNLMLKDMGKFKIGDINIPELNLVGSIYKPQTKNELDLLIKYCDAKDFVLSGLSVPSTVIVTKSFAISIKDLKKVSEEINSL